tara:strand:- start:247 stop:633 length:387 start_codon:yes stop_codon:yes gene_type:complete
MEKNIKNDKHRKFIDTYALSGNSTQAAIDAGYSEKAARQTGYKLRTRYEDEITQRVRTILPQIISENLGIVQTLAREGQSESVRLNAANTLLDRAGLKPVERIETSTSDRTPEERSQRIDALLKKRQH